MDFAWHQQLSELEWQVCCAVGDVQVPYAEHQHHVSGACPVLWRPWSPTICHGRIVRICKASDCNFTCKAFLNGQVGDGRLISQLP